MYRVPCIDGKGCPDDGEGDHIGRFHALSECCDGQQEGDGGADVLEYADGGQRDVPGGISEHEKRKPRESNGAYQKYRAQRAVADDAEPFIHDTKPDDGSRHEQEGLNEQAGSGVHTQCFLGITVQGEGKRQAEAEPRQLSVGGDTGGNAAEGQSYGQGLRAGKPFSKKNATHEYIDQRSDEVAERSFHDLPGSHGPDVQAPVQAQQKRRAEQGEQGTAAQEGRTHGGTLAVYHEDDSEEDYGPDHAVRHDGYGIHSGKLRPEKYGEAP